MAKLEANTLELVSAEYNFERMIDSVLSIIQFNVDEMNQSLIVNVDSDIPQIIIGDSQRMAQVITNLLSNAVKFNAENGSIRLDIMLEEKYDEHFILRVEVTDDGIGISREKQEKLFEAFEQADAGMSREHGGTGLGLSLVKHIVELMDGKVWVESEFGSGSDFYFTVQLSHGDNTALSAFQDESIEYDSNLEGYSILFAEDNDINREIFLEQLVHTRLNIDCAHNGAEAVNMFNNSPERYSMILMDVQMPEMDGLEATRIIRDVDATNAMTVPIIALTASADHERINSCLEAGMSDFMEKPLDHEKLLLVASKHIL